MHFIGRRNFVAGLGLGAGAHLLGAMFRRMLPEALGAPAPARKNFFLFTFAGGFLTQHYTCAARSDTDFDLTAGVYDPIAAYRKDMLILSRFYNPHDGVLHGNGPALLSLVPSLVKTTDTAFGPPGGISIDRLLAREMGASDPFSSLVIATESDGSRFTSFSSDGPGQLYPPFMTLLKAYQTVFGAGVTTPGMSLGARLASERSLFDLIKGDIGRMSVRLAAPERAKLDRYVTSLRALERQIAALGTTSGCRVPDAPTADTPTHGLNLDRLNASVDLAFHAHVCGLTRVTHIGVCSYGGQSHLSYPGTDMGDMHVVHHSLTHGQGARPGPVDYWDGKVRELQRINFGVMARLLDQLAATPDAGARMLDNSLVVHLNANGGAHHVGAGSHSVVMVGSGGGALRTGRYLAFPAKEHALSDAFVSIANAMGVPITTFGDPKICKGPLPGLAA